jgi:hypothetical protein
MKKGELAAGSWQMAEKERFKDKGDWDETVR